MASYVWRREMAESANIGIVGLGLMGTAMSQKLMEEGHSVRGFDIDGGRLDALAENGGTPASSAAEAAEDAQFVIISLLYSHVVRETCLGDGGIASVARDGLVIIDTSTSSPDDSEKLGADLRERGIGFLDASLSGSRNQVLEGKIVSVVGGEDSDFEAAEPILATFARSIHHMGPNGAGARTKLVINLVLGLTRLALSEGLVLGMKSGLDMERVLEVLKDSAAYSKAMDQRGPRMIHADYEEPLSRIKQHHKDVRLMLEQGQKLGSPMLLSSVHQQVLQAAEHGGLADADTAAIIEVFRRMAGIPSR